MFQSRAKQILEDNSLFVYPFETESIFAEVSSVANESQEWKKEGLKLPPELVELFYLTAADFALWRQQYAPIFPRFAMPIRVLPQDAKIAVLKADTSLAKPCKATTERLSSGKPIANDIFLFAGDSLKFENIAKERQWGLDALSNHKAYLEEYLVRHRDPLFYPILREIFDSQLFQVQGILWKTGVDLLYLKKTPEEISSEIQELRTKL